MEQVLNQHYTLRAFTYSVLPYQTISSRNAFLANEDKANTVDIMRDNVYHSELSSSTYYSHLDIKSSS